MSIKDIGEELKKDIKALTDNLFEEKDFFSCNDAKETLKQRDYLAFFHLMIDRLNPKFLIATLEIGIVLFFLFFFVNDFLHKDSLGNIEPIMQKNMYGYKEAHLTYTLNSKDYNLDYPVYLGAYLKFFTMNSNDYLDNVMNPDQYEFIHPLSERIKNITSNEREQVIIATSIVQHIPYDYVHLGWYQPSRRPYSVLYENKGVCGEKSMLLAFLLRDLGFGVVLFDFAAQNHEAVGVKCSNGFRGTGYCYLESTTPVGIDFSGDWLGEISETKHISDGKSIN